MKTGLAADVSRPFAVRAGLDASYSRLVRLLGVSLVLALAGCADCPHPSAITYSTAPLATGAPGCSGTPSTYADRASVPDPTATFAVGTRIEFPFCHPYYANEVASCSCAGPASGDGGTSMSSPQWVCPL